jgi:hypothetical protein
MSASRDFVAQRLVRSFSHSLKESQESSTDKTFSQRHLEGALISETECEDKLADLLKRANSTSVICDTIAWECSLILN